MCIGVHGNNNLGQKTTLANSGGKSSRGGHRTACCRTQLGKLSDTKHQAMYETAQHVCHNAGIYLRTPKSARLHLRGPHRRLVSCSLHSNDKDSSNPCGRFGNLSSCTPRTSINVREDLAYRHAPQASPFDIITHDLLKREQRAKRAEDVTLSGASGCARCAESAAQQQWGGCCRLLAVCRVV